MKDALNTMRNNQQVLKNGHNINKSVPCSGHMKKTGTYKGTLGAMRNQELLFYTARSRQGF